VALLVSAACGAQVYHRQTPSAYLSADGCLQINQDYLHTTGGYALRYLTVATGDPALPPWWEGGTTVEHPEWTRNDPYLGQGFEGAVAFEVAERLGFSDDDVRFVPVGFRESFAPGDKDFDFALRQIPYGASRAESVDFSVGYLDVHQGLVSVRGSPIARAVSLDDLRDTRLGAPAGTTGLAYLEGTIRPSVRPRVFDDLGAAVRALERGRVDGIVADLPSAAFVARERIPGGVLVGRLPAAGSPDRFAMAFEQGSPIVDCVDLALREMKDDGTLDAIRREWLADGVEARTIET
jgi:polar amino acid transport system substrate-binding protein